MDESETLGKYLKSQRESKKISLREVAKNTRVREPILKAIEEDQHTLLPPATYVKGFLLAYAKYLGLDSNDILLRYEKGLKGESIAPPSVPSPGPKQEPPAPQPSKPGPSKPGQKRRWNTRQTWVVAGVIVASFVVFYLFSPYAYRPPAEPGPGIPVVEKPSAPPSPPVAAAPPSSEPKPSGQEKKPPPPSAPVAATTSAQPRKAVFLQLKAVEQTWLSLQADDQSGQEMILKPGEEVTFQASTRMLMKLGNAGGLDLVLNGKSSGTLGKSGEVLNLIITPQGVEVKRSEKPKPPDEGTPNSEPQRSD